MVINTRNIYQGTFFIMRGGHIADVKIITLPANKQEKKRGV